MSQLYNKSKISTEKLLEKIPTECVKLREKILKLNKKNPATRNITRLQLFFTLGNTELSFV